MTYSVAAVSCVADAGPGAGGHRICGGARGGSRLLPTGCLRSRRVGLSCTLCSRGNECNCWAAIVSANPHPRLQQEHGLHRRQQSSSLRSICALLGGQQGVFEGTPMGGFVRSRARCEAGLVMELRKVCNEHNELVVEQRKGDLWIGALSPPFRMGPHLPIVFRKAVCRCLPRILPLFEGLRRKVHVFTQ
jgi:hypothetical protein